MSRMFPPQTLFPFIFLFSIITFLTHTAFTKSAIFADGRFYYAITRSLIKDHDIKFANDYEILGMEPSYTINGYSWNMYPPGVSFFWIPAFFLADGFTNLISPFSHQLGTSGFGIIHQVFVAAGSIILGLIGLYLVYKILKDYFSKEVALLTTVALFATTNLLFYIAVEPINSHAASFFISALFVYYFLRHQNDEHYYMILGVIGGVAGLIRTQDALILTLPAIKIFLNYKNFNKLTTNYLQLTTGTFIGFLPQIYFWKKIFGNFWYSPYLDVGFNFLKPQIFHVLFNTQNGLFTITPTIALAFIGLLMLKEKLSSLKFYSLLYFLLQLYLVSSWGVFYQGGSYSIRMMVTTYPLLSFGYATIISASLKKISTFGGCLIISMFTILNIVLIVRYLWIY